MRKDVKLGMAIGGGLIVLLVGYLLLAPPSNTNKKGTQFAKDGSANNIIDSAGPGDLIGNDEKSVKPAGESNNAVNTGSGNTATGGNSGSGNLSTGNRSGDNPGSNPAGGT